MLQYLLTFLCVASYCVATDTNFLQGQSTCNDENLSATQKFLCMYSNGFNPALQNIYITGPPQWRMHKLTQLLDKAGSDYLLTPGMGAHKFHHRKLSWSQARKICIKEGGHLVIINSNSEEKLLLRIMEERKIEKAWLGVHDQFEEGDWTTILDEPMETSGYSKWTTKIANLPDNWGGKQHCGLLLKDGGMDDFDCSTPHPFFCEINF
ncbi:hemolymph lipopolysaccharide-binding protein-like isoform X2 [Odontomachus brunneus]|uniref:hemolymph lipopolysaccharide-binding protein-like isoform X2 n=1 Tax=Odontomachus brunneus TaxID=486640 RepID=UPI0013F29A4C|nr:hemolymph lipopolysaccharide-binding protein-like isoform X2 [Odontomachus brunneus]